jgi:hypothetical protein
MRTQTFHRLEAEFPEKLRRTGILIAIARTAQKLEDDGENQIILAESADPEEARSSYQQWRYRNPDLSEIVHNDDVAVDVLRTDGGGTLYRYRLKTPLTSWQD